MNTVLHPSRVYSIPTLGTGNGASTLLRKEAETFFIYRFIRAGFVCLFFCFVLFLFCFVFFRFFSFSVRQVLRLTFPLAMLENNSFVHLGLPISSYSTIGKFGEH